MMHYLLRHGDSTCLALGSSQNGGVASLGPVALVLEYCFCPTHLKPFVSHRFVGLPWSILSIEFKGDRARYERAQTAHDLEGQFVQSTSKKNLEMTSSLVARKKVRCAM